MKALKKISILVFYGLQFSAVYSQTIIKGSVKDINGLPVAGATVFEHKTTNGTETDSEGNYALTITDDITEIAACKAGYYGKSVILNPVSKQAANFELSPNFQNKEAALSGSPFHVASLNFKNNVIGMHKNSEQCIIKNDHALNYYYADLKEQITVIKATEPIEIINKATGYSITLFIDSFVHNAAKYRYDLRAYILFKELNGSSKAKARWLKKRAEAYKGSSLEFFRSYLMNNLPTSGFKLLKPEKADDKTQAEIESAVKADPLFLKKNKTPFGIVVAFTDGRYRIMKTLEISEIIKSTNEIKIPYEFIEITYPNNDKADGLYHSFLELREVPFITIAGNGRAVTKDGLKILGSWLSYEKLESLLPYDYNAALNP